MNPDKVGHLVSSISSIVAVAISINDASGEDVMRALAMVSLTTQHLHAEGVKSESAANIFDSVAMELQPVPD